MELNINISTSNSCKVIILDKTEYLSESYTEIVKGKFKYSDTISIDVLQHNKVQETIYRDITYTLHNNLDSIQLPVKFDGWFTIIHIVLPTKQWFENELSKVEASAIGLYNIVYYSDGSSVYKYINGQSLQITIDEILEINPEDTTISKVLNDYVSICFLRKCYINLCLKIFNNRGLFPCQNNNDSDLVYKRDLVWMAINVIKYLTECELLAEVLRLIESLQGCNGLCASTDVTSKTNGCGCR